MTLSPANRKFFPQLIAKKTKPKYILVLSGTKGVYGQGRPLKVNPVQEARPSEDNIWIFINLSQTCRSVSPSHWCCNCLLYSCLFFIFCLWYFLYYIVCGMLFCSTHTLSKKFCASDREKLILPAVQPCRRLWRFSGEQIYPEKKGEKFLSGTKHLNMRISEGPTHMGKAKNPTCLQISTFTAWRLKCMLMRTEMMTLSPANRKFFPQLIGP